VSRRRVWGSAWSYPRIRGDWKKSWSNKEFYSSLASDTEAPQKEIDAWT
jgi:hypothetical protein